MLNDWNCIAPDLCAGSGAHTLPEEVDCGKIYEAKR